jgi:hypothetical protein
MKLHRFLRPIVGVPEVHNLYYGNESLHSDTEHCGVVAGSKFRVTALKQATTVSSHVAFISPFILSVGAGMAQSVH